MNIMHSNYSNSYNQNFGQLIFSKKLLKSEPELAKNIMDLKQAQKISQLMESIGKDVEVRYSGGFVKNGEQHPSIIAFAVENRLLNIFNETDTVSGYYGTIENLAKKTESYIDKIFKNFAKK